MVPKIGQDARKLVQTRGYKKNKKEESDINHTAERL